LLLPLLHLVKLFTLIHNPIIEILIPATQKSNSHLEFPPLLPLFPALDFLAVLAYDLSVWAAEVTQKGDQRFGLEERRRRGRRGDGEVVYGRRRMR
jgi:hypothetical protein